MSNIQITCNYCGYRIIDSDKIFYMENNSDELVEASINFYSNILKYGTYGRVFTSYCSNCKSIVKFYILEKSNENLDNLFNLINDLSDKPSKVFTIENNPFIKTNEYGFFKEVYDKDSKIECPKCIKEIPIRISQLGHCPKCGSSNLDKFTPCLLKD
ncbi:MAG: hypothetical protein ACI37V_07920 [Methanobrevibacter sp.]